MCPPAVPHELCLFVRAHTVTQLFLATGARVQRPSVSTICPWQLVLKSEGLRCRTNVRGDSGPVPRVCRVDRLSRVTRALARGHMGSTSSPGTLVLGSEVPRGRPAVPGISSPDPKALGVDQLSRVAPGPLRVPAGSTSSHGPLVLGSEGPLGRPGVRGRPAVSGDSGPWLRASGVDQHSQVSRVQIRCPTGSTRFPGRSGPVPEAPWCKTYIP